MLPRGRSHGGSARLAPDDAWRRALAKLERGHSQDVADVEEPLARGLVESARIRSYFDDIEPQLYRFPAVDPVAFRRAVEDVADTSS